MRAVALVPLLAVLGCGEERVKSLVPPAPLAGVTRADLERLAGKRVYFGHQSVGYNLVDGLKEVARARPELALRIVESRAASALLPGTFVHAVNGRNQEPLSKIEDFARALDAEGLGARVDLAFFKFCYVDFRSDTDVGRVFAEYQRTAARLKQAHPAVTFVHVTAPLTVVASGPKVWLRGLLGKRPWGADANVARERFNALLREAYAGREPVFDLAAVEATRPDGTIETFRLDGASHPGLVPAYAADGSHLNGAGARWAAEHLVATLAAATR